MNRWTELARFFAIAFTLVLWLISGVSEVTGQGVVNDTMHFNRYQAQFHAVLAGKGNGATVIGSAGNVWQPWQILRYNWQHGDTTYLFFDPDSSATLSYASAFAGRNGPVIMARRNPVGVDRARTGLIFLDSAGQFTGYRTLNSLSLLAEELIPIDGVFFQDKYFMLMGKQFHDSSSTRADLILMITDSLGNVLKEVDYAEPGKLQIPYHIIVSSDSTLALGYTMVTLLPNSGRQIQASILNIDTSGVVKNMYSTSTTEIVNGPVSFVATRDKGIALLLQVTDTNSFNSFRVVKLNASWQAVWSHPLDTQFNYRPAFFNMRETADGSLLLTGQQITDISNPGIDLPATAGLLLKISAHGSLLWSRLYEPFSPLFVRNLATLRGCHQLANGDILLAGIADDATDLSPLPASAWLLKVDSLGCLIPGCAVSVRELTREEAYLKAWPNPVSDVLYVLYKASKPLPGAELRLTDMQGKIRYQAGVPEQDVQYFLPTHTLEAGVYVLQLVYDERLVARVKVFVTR